MRFIDKLKTHFKTVLSIKKAPHAIALGFAVGTFIAVLPTPGLSLLIAVMITFLYPKISKISLFSAILIWNPLVTIPSNLIGYKIGDALFSGAAAVTYELSAFDHAWNFSRKLFVGNFILALSISLVTYFVLRACASRFQEFKAAKKK